MTLNVNGVDLTPYIAYQGVKWQRNDVDGPNAGRTLGNAYMYRDRVATKIRLDCTCSPLKAAEAAIILKAIKPEYVTVTYTDPEEGAVRNGVEMYSNNVPATFCQIDRHGVEWWMGIAFPLIER